MTKTIRQERRRMADFRAFCRRQGLRLTFQRLTVYRELARLTTHPDAETVYLIVRRKIPTVSFDTIYRTLRMLEGKGLIFCAAFVANRRRYDANTKQHHHFICIACGRVMDVVSPALNRLLVRPEISALGRMHSLQIKLRGTCADCMRQGRGRVAGGGRARALRIANESSGLMTAKSDS